MDLFIEASEQFYEVIAISLSHFRDDVTRVGELVQVTQGGREVARRPWSWIYTQASSCSDFPLVSLLMDEGRGHVARLIWDPRPDCTASSASLESAHLFIH